ncbi:MAG: hypothetical protein WCF13_05065 [Stellaceae bacterium]
MGFATALRDSAASADEPAVFDGGEKFLMLDLTPQRVHLFMAAILDISGTAEWDFPPLATWLDGGSLAAGQAVPKALH